MKFISITPENVSNYEDIIKTQNMPSFVKFYSPNCGHCQAMQPAWDALENNTDVKGMGIAIIEVRDDAINSITHNSGKNVLGFPTIRVIINGKITKEYNGDRSTNDMVKFIKENIKSNSKKTNRHQRGGKKTKKSKKSKKTKRTHRRRV